MKERKNKKEFKLPDNWNSTRDKNDHESDKPKHVGETLKSLERVNELLEKCPVPQWIMDL